MKLRQPTIKRHLHLGTQWWKETGEALEQDSLFWAQVLQVASTLIELSHQFEKCWTLILITGYEVSAGCHHPISSLQEPLHKTNSRCWISEYWSAFSHITGWSCWHQPSQALWSAGKCIWYIHPRLWNSLGVMGEISILGSWYPKSYSPPSPRPWTSHPILHQHSQILFATERWNSPTITKRMSNTPQCTV